MYARTTYVCPDHLYDDRSTSTTKSKETRDASAIIDLVPTSPEKYMKQLSAKVGIK